ncbi:MAG: outer membrane lipoprotein chaperone LolA [Litorivicinus sp.]
MKWLAVLASMLMSSAWATPADELQARLGAIETLIASFTQLARDAGGRQIQSVPGTMALQRPNFLFWETRDPIPQQIVSDGDSLWVFDLDLEQVTREPAASLMDTPAGLLLNLDAQALGERFEVSGGGDRYTLIPREDTIYQMIVLEFDRDAPRLLGVVDSTGQQTRINLREVALNAEVPPARFQFELADGVDLIDAR